MEKLTRDWNLPFLIIFPYFCFSSSFTFLHDFTCICPACFSLLRCIVFTPPFSSILYHNVGSSQMLALLDIRALWHHIRRRCEAPLQCSSLVYIRRLWGFQGYSGVCSVLERTRVKVTLIGHGFLPWGMCSQRWSRIITSSHQRVREPDD